MNIDDRTLLLELIKLLRGGLRNARLLTPVMPEIWSIIHLVDTRDVVERQHDQRWAEEARARMQARQEAAA